MEPYIKFVFERLEHAAKIRNGRDFQVWYDMGIKLCFSWELSICERRLRGEERISEFRFFTFSQDKSETPRIKLEIQEDRKILTFFSRLFIQDCGITSSQQMYNTGFDGSDIFVIVNSLLVTENSNSQLHWVKNQVFLSSFPLIHAFATLP